MNFKQKLASCLKIENTNEADIEKMIVQNVDNKNGDFSLPCFRFAKTYKTSPNEVAKMLAEQLQSEDYVQKTECINGYLNIFVSQGDFFEKTVLDILSQKENFGDSAEGEGKTICIDFSSINIAKPFHIGHLSTTVIGNSLYKIFKKLGYNVVGINHLGDYGTQFGKLISAYKRWGNKEEVEKNSIRALLSLYVKFHEEEKTNPALTEEARHYFVQIENKDPECLEIFNWFKKLTLAEVDKIYKLLGVHFDSYNGESFYSDKMDIVLDELRAKNLLVKSEGADVVNLSAYDMPPCLILKADGATLYATRDLAAIYYRKKTYDFYRCLYVVAYQQNLHFRQIFKVMELLGYNYNLEHIAFGMVSLQGMGALSTRKGNVVFLEDIIADCISKAKEIILQKSGNIENLDDTAKKIGVGALIFSTLYNARIKDITFNLEKVLNFDGETAPYVQYTYARCNSVLKKADFDPQNIDFSLLNEIEQKLIKLFATFPQTIVEASQKCEPCLISRLLIEICKTYNKFYFDNRIICDDKKIQNMRLGLTACAKQIIKNGLALLSIECVEKM